MTLFPRIVRAARRGNVGKRIGPALDRMRLTQRADDEGSPPTSP
jgi:hypothetical protein